MKWSVENKILAGFAIAVTFIAVVGGMAYQASYRYIEVSRRLMQSQEALVTLEEIYSLVSQAESGQRAYLITSDESYYLQPRNAAVNRVWELVAQLRQISADEPGRQQQLREIEHQLAVRLDILDEVLRLRQLQGLEAARQQLLSGAGRAEMEQLRDMITLAEREERKLLKQRTGEAQSYADRTLATLSTTLLFVMVFMSMLFLRIRREMGERNRAQEALSQYADRLRDSEARVNAIVETALEGIIVINEQGVIDRFNPAAARMFGYAETEVLGKNVSMLMPSPYREEHDGYLERYRRTGEKRMIGRSREMTGLRKDGTAFPMELAISETPLENHRMFTGVIRDITERKEAEQQQARLMQELESANDELKNFAYVVSHDLKAPLRAIGSLADWISADYADRFDEEGKEHMRLLINRVRRMDGLIDGILQYSRVGRLKEESAPVALDQLVREVIDLLSPPKNIAITIEDPLPVVSGERTRLQQVFQNLLSNAIKYMDKPQGEIRIGCRADGGEWKFSVSDNGPGIEERHFERIFHLFQTLAPRDRVESTGVGLALVKKIVEMYGGRVWVESAVGKGSTFFFTLPKAAEKKARSRK